jgi:hypothetical protein
MLDPAYLDDLRNHLRQVPLRDDRTWADLGHAVASFCEANEPRAKRERRRHRAAEYWGPRFSRGWISNWVSQYNKLSTAGKRELITWLRNGAE